ncbi:hypothetical protein D3C76_1122940 [compost metagenome]
MLMCARGDGDCRLTLANGTFNRRYLDGRVESRKIDDALELIEVLKQDFLLDLREVDTEPLRERLTQLLKG